MKNHTKQKNSITSTIILLACSFSLSLACSGGGGGSSPVADPTILTITPTNEKAVESDGAGLLPEERDGSGEMDSSTAPVLLGTISDNKNTNDKAVYKLATDDDAVDTDNAKFSIDTTINTGTGMATSQLFYIGSALDFESTSDAKKSFSLKIERYNNEEAVKAEGGGNPQILQYIVNLKDLEEVLTITPDTSATYFSVENGEAFLDENTDGSTEKLLGTIIDNIMTPAVVAYKLAATTDSNDNGNFRIDTATSQIYYTGSALDFESLTDKKQLTLDIIRTLNGDTATEQTLQRIVNLKNLNDNAPVIEGNIAESETEIDYIAAGNVGGTDADGYFYAMSLRVGADGDTIDIEFMKGGAHLLRAAVEYTGTKVTKFIFTMGITNTGNLAVALNDKNNSGNLRDVSTEDYRDAWVEVNKHLVFIVLIGADIGSSAGSAAHLYSSAVTLTGKKGIVVEAGTTGIIANFSDNDPDGDLNDFTYSLSDTVDSSGDSNLFSINADGELSFKAAPSYDSTTPASNDHEITITVSDGTNSDTYDLLVQVIE